MKAEDSHKLWENTKEGRSILPNIVKQPLFKRICRAILKLLH